MIRILISGAGGMLGCELVNSFRTVFQVIGADRKPNPNLGIPYYQIELEKSDEVKQCLVTEKPNIVFHAAAMTDVDGCEIRRTEALAGNFEATKNLVEACNQIGAVLVFFSTDYVFDGKKEGEYLESDLPCPLSYYGETKYLAEKYIREQAKQFVIFRLSWLYGINGRNFPVTILEKAKTTDCLKVVSDQIGRPTYARDISEALYRMLERDGNALQRMSGEVFHLANSGYCSWAEFAATILKIARFDHVRVEFVDSHAVKRAAVRPANSILSIEKVHEKLGIRLRPWRDAIQEFVLELLGKDRSKDHG